MTGARTDATLLAGRATTLAGRARRALRYELGMWRSLWRWVLRRPGVDLGSAFSYAGVVSPVMWAFIGVSAVEVPLVHVLLPWPTVRAFLLFVGVYGLLWMVGLLASLWVHPHLVDDEGLRVRYGPTLDLRIPWADVADARMRRRSTTGMRGVQAHGSGADRVLDVAVSNQTVVDVVLRRPLPLLAGRGDAEPVSEVRLYADDARGLVRHVREELRSRGADGGGAQPR